MFERLYIETTLKNTEELRTCNIMKNNKFTDKLENTLIWLSASDPGVLKEKCPRWEKIKYEAFGASVLVPVFFGMIASSYAISTLTNNWFFIGMFALVWGFIILTIDRVLLSTYRAFVSKSRKWVQFALRITVAVLMGLTVSHPLTLLLFKDTINSEIEKERTQEMLAMRDKTKGQKEALEERIRVVSAELADHQQKYQDTVSGKFLNEAPAAQPTVSRPASDTRFADIDAQIRDYKIEREAVRRDLESWQTTYDEEVRGVRSGKSGIGPNARAIERDHLVWRRDEIKRLNGVISELTSRRTRLSSELMARNMEISASLEANRRDLEKRKMEMFASQQGNLLEVIKGQIDSTSAELAMLREDAGQLSTDTSDRVAHLKTEKRADLMMQTHVLHKIFKKPEGGGTFALAVYIVLVGLFTLIDTIPLVVKFCSVPGLYDKHLYYKENSVRAIGIDEVIDDKFSESMKKRDDILHELLVYNPLTEEEKVAQARLLPPPAEPEEIEQPVVEEKIEQIAEVAAAKEEPELVVAVDEEQLTAIEGVELKPALATDEINTYPLPRAITGNVPTNLPLDQPRWESDAADILVNGHNGSNGHNGHNGNRKNGHKVNGSSTPTVEVSNSEGTLKATGVIASALELNRDKKKVAEVESEAQRLAAEIAEINDEAQKIAVEAEEAAVAQRSAEKAEAHRAEVAEAAAAELAPEVETIEVAETAPVEPAPAVEVIEVPEAPAVAAVEETLVEEISEVAAVAEASEVAAVEQVIEETSDFVPQDLSEVYHDEPSMLEPGFGAVLLAEETETETADFSAEIEIPVNNSPQVAEVQPTFKNKWSAQKAAGGLALQPTNLSEKAR